MERIGEYEDLRLIGEGGMGKVYEGKERLSGRRVALKVLRPELLRSEEARRLFLNEIQILAHLEHPSLVRSLSSFEAEGQLVLVLEYLHGRTLRQELAARGRFGWDEAVEIACKIADGLKVAHAQATPIVHRDLKPENVMLVTRDGAAEGTPVGVKVMDFGVAKILEGAQGTSTQSVGTLQYMSPEQIDARGVDGRTDLYALGLVLYEMIAGRPPFASASPRELLNMQCTAAPPPLPDEAKRGLPRGVESVIRSLLEKDVSARPANADAVLAALAPFRTDDVVARPASTSGASGKAVDSKPRPDRASSSPTSDAGVAPEAPRAGTDTELSSGVKKRLDTVAALEGRAPKEGTPKKGGRDVPTGISIALVLALSVVAGLGTYLVRSSRAPTSVAPEASALAVPDEGR